MPLDGIKNLPRMLLGGLVHGQDKGPIMQVVHNGIGNARQPHGNSLAFLIVFRDEYWGHATRNRIPFGGYDSKHDRRRGISQGLHLLSI